MPSTFFNQVLADFSKLRHEFDKLHANMSRTEFSQRLATMARLSVFSAILPVSRNITVASFTSFSRESGIAVFDHFEDAVVLRQFFVQYDHTREVIRRILTIPITIVDHVLTRMQERASISNSQAIKQEFSSIILVGNLISMLKTKSVSEPVAIYSPAGLFLGDTYKGWGHASTFVDSPFEAYGRGARQLFWVDLGIWYYMHYPNLVKLLVMRPILDFYFTTNPEFRKQFINVADGWVNVRKQHSHCLISKDIRDAWKRKRDLEWKGALAQKYAEELDALHPKS